MNEEIKPENVRIHSRADELIACLEGEIAKRDETIARLEPQLNRAIQANYDLREELAACRVAVENCDLFRARIVGLESRYQRDVYGLNNEGDPIGGDPAGGYANDNARLRAELAAIKEQEPVAWISKDGTYAEASTKSTVYGSHTLPLYAAPVSEAKAQDFDPLVCDYCNAETQDPWHGSGMLNGVESRHIHACSQCRNLLPTAKAQGVVQWPEADEIMQMAFEEGHPADDASGYYFELEEFDLFIERLMSEVARLNAAPCQHSRQHWNFTGGGHCDDCGAPIGTSVAATVQQVSDDELLEVACHHGNGNKARRRAEAIAAQARLGSAILNADGYVRAPVEPTEDMVFAGCAALVGSIGGYEAGLVERCYDAMLAAAPATPAADAWLVAVEWAKDAEEWGPALNEAGWLFLSELNDPQKSALIFNNTKGPLRAAIMKYADIVAANAKDSSHD